MVKSTCDYCTQISRCVWLGAWPPWRPKKWQTQVDFASQRLASERSLGSESGFACPAVGHASLRSMFAKCLSMKGKVTQERHPHGCRGNYTLDTLGSLSFKSKVNDRCSGSFMESEAIDRDSVSRQLKNVCGMSAFTITEALFFVVVISIL